MSQCRGSGVPVRPCQESVTEGGRTFSELDQARVAAVCEHDGIPFPHANIVTPAVPPLRPNSRTAATVCASRQAIVGASSRTVPAQAVVRFAGCGTLRYPTRDLAAKKCHADTT